MLDDSLRVLDFVQFGVPICFEFDIVIHNDKTCMLKSNFKRTRKQNERPEYL